MGFLDSLFGGGNKAEKPKAKPQKEKAVQPAPPVVELGVSPEVLAAISASVSMMMEDASAELIAAVTAAIVHARGGGTAVRFKRTSNAWAAAGRQKVMDGRQFI